MYHLSDKDLDRLSNDAADNFEPELGVSGWEKLEGRLNEELPQNKKDRRRFFFLLLSIVLICGTGMVWTILPKKEKAIKEHTAVQRTENNADAQPYSEKKQTVPENLLRNPKIVDNKETIDTKQPSSDISDAAISGTKPAPGANAVEANRVAESSDILKSPVLNKQLIKKSSVGKNRSATPPARERSTIPAVQQHNQANASEKDADQNIVKTDAINADTAAYNNTKPETGLSDKFLVDSNQNQTQDVSTITNDAEKPIAQQNDADEAIAKKDSSSTQSSKKNIKSQPLEIGITAGPDLSTIKYAYLGKPGYNVGIQLGYRFAERWSVHSGITYTQKDYAAKGKDFHPPKNYWINYVDLNKVQGKCFMLDIPLNIRYVVSSGKKNKLFVSSGLSTYLMDKESYSYFYTLDGIDKSSQWTNHKNSNFVFSVLNLSAGYEKPLNKHLFIQVEPYIKTPLKGIGFGSMQMDSYGIYFSLIYKPSLK